MSGVIWPDGAVVPGSFRDGFVVKQKTGLEATITAGIYEANGKKYILTSDATLVIMPPTAFTRYYICIDDSESALTFIYSTTPPVWSPTKRGHYIGDDCCIGVQISKNGVQTLAYHETNIISDRKVEYIYEKTTFAAMASAIDTTGEWTPPTTNSSVLVPVNAVVLRLLAHSSDSLPAESSAAIYAASSEYAAIYAAEDNNCVYNFRGGKETTEVSHVPLGASQDIMLSSEGDDDVATSAWCGGFIIER